MARFGRRFTGWTINRKAGPWHMLVDEPSWSLTTICGASVYASGAGAASKEVTRADTMPNSGKACPKCLRLMPESCRPAPVADPE